MRLLFAVRGCAKDTCTRHSSPLNSRLRGPSIPSFLPSLGLQVPVGRTSSTHASASCRTLATTIDAGTIWPYTNQRIAPRTVPRACRPSPPRTAPWRRELWWSLWNVCLSFRAERREHLLKRPPSYGERCPRQDQGLYACFAFSKTDLPTPLVLKRPMEDVTMSARLAERRLQTAVHMARVAMATQTSRGMVLDVF